MKQQPFLALRVTLEVDGSTITRDYVRGQTRMGLERFGAFALGDLIALTDSRKIENWTIEEVTFEQVADNRKFHHTTHAE